MWLRVERRTKSNGASIHLPVVRMEENETERTIEMNILSRAWAKVKPYIIAEEPETFHIKTKNFELKGSFTDPESMILLRECVYRTCDRNNYDDYGDGYGEDEQEVCFDDLGLTD